jgi:uncharacterized lipoprotein YehR (DUF1307 family)
MSQKVTFYYPENGDKVVYILTTPVTEFQSREEAEKFLKEISSNWQEIEAQNDSDKAAYLNQRTGDLIVLREVLP